jgi:hypothetical protein
MSEDTFSMSFFLLLILHFDSHLLRNAAAWLLVAV